MRGQAPDYGLYVPVKIPKLKPETIESFKKKKYFEIAFDIVRPFVTGLINDKDLIGLTKDAYDFDVPLEKVRNDLFIMRLDRGPTASFKDFAARLMARLMHYFSSSENKKLTILVATSGDTGGAVADAFYKLDNVSVVILFPEDEVTERQRRQMTTLGENVNAIAVKGKFDDCQQMVKRAFNDKRLSLLNLTSANSINFGRLLPQSIYYFYAGSRLNDNNLTFSIPSGNFGNLMGGVLAKNMGLGIKFFIVAVNENDEFPDFLKTGTYKPVVPSRQCTSNAMNVGHPSNLARLIDFYGGWLLDERDGSGRVLATGVLKEKPDMVKLANDFRSYSISDKQARDTILNVYRDYRIILEPHGAVAVCAAQQAEMDSCIVCLETASPAKFPEEVYRILKIEPDVPESLTGLDIKKESYQVINKDYEQFMDVLRNK